MPRDSSRPVRFIVLGLIAAAIGAFVGYAGAGALLQTLLLQDATGAYVTASWFAPALGPLVAGLFVGVVTVLLHRRREPWWLVALVAVVPPAVWVVRTTAVVAGTAQVSGGLVLLMAWAPLVLGAGLAVVLSRFVSRFAA